MKKEKIKLSKGKLIITKETEIDVKTDNIEIVKKQLRKELDGIIRYVKELKSRAEEIKEILDKL